MINFNNNDTFNGFLWCLFLSFTLLWINDGCFFIPVVWGYWFFTTAYPNRKKKPTASDEDILYKVTGIESKDFFDCSSYETTYLHKYYISQAETAEKYGRHADAVKALDRDEFYRNLYNSKKAK